MEKQNSTVTNNKVKLLCSYGGKIQPRPTDHQLSYLGGETKILAVDRSVLNFSEIISKLNSLTNRNDDSEISIKYQLPGEDLDNLVSLIDDDDVEHMIVEYDRMQRISAKPVRIRIFVFDICSATIPPAKSSIKVPASDSGNPDYLFGFDKEYQPSIGPPLDLLQIPGMVLPQNYGLVPREAVQVQSESHVTERGNNVNWNGTAAGQAVYRIPVVANGGVYQTGQYAYGLVTGLTGGNRQQPVYNFVPLMPSVAEQRMISAGNELEGKVDQHIF